MNAARRILLIDDNASLREVLTTRLHAHGFEVVAVSSGQAGLEAAARDPFDLVLLDMLMPGKDGVTTFQELRANSKTRCMPVILMTAVAVEGHWEPMPYETDGPAFVMGKPYDYGELIERITQVLGNGGEKRLEP